ncbi:hypothetical protein B0H19DRAFT_1084673 [Mycena capillaripes]|nr:hypothetical protein B0H19DRAFT_1084673 [Mycena capillaripes]
MSPSSNVKLRKSLKPVKPSCATYMHRSQHSSSLQIPQAGEAPLELSAHRMCHDALSAGSPDVCSSCVELIAIESGGQLVGTWQPATGDMCHTCCPHLAATCLPSAGVVQRIRDASCTIFSISDVNHGSFRIVTKHGWVTETALQAIAAEPPPKNEESNAWEAPIQDLVDLDVINTLLNRIGRLL